MLTVYEYTGNGSPNRNIDLGAVYKYVSISQIIATDHVASGAYVINSANCNLLGQGETAYVYYASKAKKASLNKQILTVYNENIDITSSALNKTGVVYKVICYFKI